MTLRSRLFPKDARRSSQDLASNLQYLISKACRDKPVKLSQLKTEYDRYFKDKISTKAPEAVTAALKAIEDTVVTVKIHLQDGNREMTDSLIGLRAAPYAAEMRNEDSPQASKERLLQIIREQASNGIYVRDIEDHYVTVYGNRPSYLPYKSLKGLLHRTPEVELASSGKNLRVRIRQHVLGQSGSQTSVVHRRPTLSQIPALNRSSVSGITQSLRARRPRDIMSMSMFRPNDRSIRDEMRSEMTRSVLIPSSTPSESSSPSMSSSGSASPNGSVDMSVSMILAPSRPSNDVSRAGQKSFSSRSIEDLDKHNKDIMAAILNGLPPEGLPLKGLIEEFVAISGQAIPLDMTAVDFLKKDFGDVVNIADDPEGLRVFRVNSPLCPRRTLADVYTRIALHSNRKPSDRVLKVLKDIYKNRESATETRTASAPTYRLAPEPKESSAEGNLEGATTDEVKEDLREAAKEEARQRPRTRLTSTSQRGREEIVADLKKRLAEKPVEYPEEFEKIVEGSAADNQSLLMELMSSMNLCLKPSAGRMVLTAN